MLIAAAVKSVTGVLATSIIINAATPVLRLASTASRQLYQQSKPRSKGQTEDAMVVAYLVLGFCSFLIF
jgi:hypothetical protein